ncbi:MAG: thymidine phosphorylase [Oscillospiraceae bacterium]
MIGIYEFINDKRRGKEHSAADIRWFVRGVTSGDFTDYQVSAWLMAVCLNGMTDRETTALTLAMEHSGDVFSPCLDKFCVDKHSTGGVGDKVTLFSAPVCASCGVYVPKMSGRGLGFTGGTIDKLEAIPGLRTSLDYDEFTTVVKKAGFAITGQTGSLCPADKKLYALRNATATVESIPLICSSIMSKKLATGADGIVLDVKVGDGAFMKDEQSAEELASAMLRTAELAGKKASALLTDMSKPLGRNVGNALEVIEAIEALKGNAEEDFAEVAYAVTAEMLSLAGSGTPEQCMELVRGAVASGRALESLRKMIELQGGDPRVIEDYSLFAQPKYKRTVYADREGYIGGISCEKTGLASLNLGAGRKDKASDIDMSAGIVFRAKVGDFVNKGDELAVLYTSTDCDIDSIVREFAENFTVCENQVKKRKNVIKILRNC